MMPHVPSRSQERRQQADDKGDVGSRASSVTLVDEQPRKRHNRGKSVSSSGTATSMTVYEKRSIEATSDEFEAINAAIRAERREMDEIQGEQMHVAGLIGIGEEFRRRSGVIKQRKGQEDSWTQHTSVSNEELNVNQHQPPAAPEQMLEYTAQHYL